MGALTPWCVCNWGSEISVGIIEQVRLSAEATATGAAFEEEVQALGTHLAKGSGVGS